MNHAQPGDTPGRWRSKWKRMRRDTRYRLGFAPAFGPSAGARILVYHGLCRTDLFRYNTLFITQKTFEAQLRLFKKYFQVVSLDDFYAQRFSPEKFTVCLSFDDGFANNHRYVLPLLEAYEVPAAFFVTAIRDAGYDVLWNDVLSIAGKLGPAELSLGGRLFLKSYDGKYRTADNGNDLGTFLRSAGFGPKAEMIRQLGACRHRAHEDHWLQMTEDQLRSLAASKWATVGAHGYYHNDLGSIGDERVQEELHKSKQYLERITGKEIRALAFPYGAYVPATLQEARRAGFSQLLATSFVSPGDAADATLRERLTIHPFISPINQLYASIAGNYQ